MTPLLASDPPAYGRFRLLGRLSDGPGGTFLAQDGSAWAVVRAAAGLPGYEAASRLVAQGTDMSRVASPYVAQFLDGDFAGAQPWFATQYIPGITLDQAILAEGVLRGPKLLWLARATAEALVDIHRSGTLAGNLKPARVVMSTAGPRLTSIGSPAQPTAGVAGMFWLAPEQVAGHAAGPATDIHAWALLVTYAATGVTAFAADTVPASAYRVQNLVPALPADMPAQLATTVGRALAKDPAARPSLAEILSLLPPLDALLAAPATSPAASQTAPAAQPTVVVVSQQAPPPAPPARKSRAGWAALVVILLLLAAAGVVAAVVRSTNPSQPDVSTSPSATSPSATSPSATSPSTTRPATPTQRPTSAAPTTAAPRTTAATPTPGTPTPATAIPAPPEATATD